MRVISGTARGHKLQAPEGMDTRPTTDRIKESLFNILAPDLSDCRFLDLYSGTGAIGIEALSRGAGYAVFVETDAEAKRIIEQNLFHTKLQERAVIYQKDVQQAIMELGKKKEFFDIIFMDPPYHGDYVENSLEWIIEANILTPNGYIVVERAADHPIPQIDGLAVLKEKSYKTTAMTFIGFQEDPK